MMNPRIIGGKFKNRALEVPETARPITDRVKRSMFDTISDIVEDASCLDLFAGSGSIGIEALSRGARKCTFVEKDIEASMLLEQNLSKFELSSEEYEVVNQDCETYLSEAKESFDIVFLDPPFDSIEGFKLESLKNVLTENSYVVLKAEKNHKINFECFEVVKESKMGINVLYYFQKK